MKSTPVYFLLSLLAFTASGVIADTLKPVEKSLLQDTDFAFGYEVMSPARDIYTDRSVSETVHANKSQKHKPIWRLVQWGSAVSIAAAQPLILSDGALSWAAEANSPGTTLIYKRVTTGLRCDLPDKTSTKSLMLELNGLAEFSTPLYRDKNLLKNKANRYLATADEHWPHLLMVQNLNTEKLSSYQALNLSLDARLLFDEKHISEGYQHDRHAARFVVSIAVHNTMANNSFWLNLVIYDDRYVSSGFLCQKCRDKNRNDCYTPVRLEDPGLWSCPFDGERWSKESEKRGTGRMLFRLPTSAATTANIQDGGWVGYQVNLLPYIKAGIEAARSDKTLGGFPASLEFYDLTLFSMGWEITGLNHSAMQIRQLSLQAL
jgi:hypothetical protein